MLLYIYTVDWSNSWERVQLPKVPLLTRPAEKANVTVQRALPLPDRRSPYLSAEACTPALPRRCQGQPHRQCSQPALGFCNSQGGLSCVKGCGNLGAGSALGGDSTGTAPARIKQSFSHPRSACRLFFPPTELLSQHSQGSLVTAVLCLCCDDH